MGLQRRYYYTDGVEETSPDVFIAKHHLAIEPAWNAPNPYWLAEATSFQEDVYNSRHLVVRGDIGAFAEGDRLQIAWWYPTVKEDRQFIPRTMNPAYPFAVLLNAHAALAAGQPTTSDGAPFRCWVNCPDYLGFPVISETVHLGMVGSHIQLDTLWTLRPVGFTPGGPPPPPPTTGTAGALAEAHQLTMGTAYQQAQALTLVLTGKA